jgi:hypothetical protein
VHTSAVNALANFTIVILFSLWGFILLSRFLQGLSSQTPEAKALFALFNYGRSDDDPRSGAREMAQFLAIVDAINQGLIFFLSDLARYLRYKNTDAHTPVAKKTIVKYLLCAGFMGINNAVATRNGMIDAGADLHLTESVAQNIGVAEALATALSTAFFAYSRGLEKAEEVCWPSTSHNRLKFLFVALISYLGQGAVNFYQSNRAFGLIGMNVTLMLLGWIGMTYTQMRVFGHDLVLIENNQKTVAATTASLSGVRRFIFNMISIINWLNVLSGTAMLRSNLTEIPAYKAQQQELYCLLPTLMLGVLIGIISVLMVRSFRLSSIRELLSTGDCSKVGATATTIKEVIRKNLGPPDPYAGLLISDMNQSLLLPLA